VPASAVTKQTPNPRNDCITSALVSYSEL
jgi:hypothetical protein